MKITDYKEETNNEFEELQKFKDFMILKEIRQAMKEKVRICSYSKDMELDIYAGVEMLNIMKYLDKDFYNELKKIAKEKFEGDTTNE